MLLQPLTDQLWLGLLLVALLYALDYQLTLVGQRWHRRGADVYYTLQGSYELNPPFVDDVESSRRISLKHILAIGRIWLVLALVWWLTTVYLDFPDIYLGAVGFFVLLQLPVLMRHVQNVVLFRFVVLRGGVEGRTTAARWLDLKVTAAIFFYFAAAYLVLWLLLGSALFLGGVLGSLLAGARFWIFGDEAEEEGRTDETADTPASSPTP